MPVSSDDVLRNAQKPVYLVETQLPNTIRHAWDRKDHLAGSTPLGASLDSTPFRSNSNVRISTESVINGATMPLIVSGMTRDYSLGEPYEGSSLVTAYASFSVLNTLTDDVDFNNLSEQKLSDLSDRRFKGRTCSVKVGGEIYRGTPDAQILNYSEYVDLFEGRFKSLEINNSFIDLSIEPISDELSGLFPKNEYTFGDAEGLPKPVTYGTPKGVVLRSLGGGIHQWHDGNITLSATEAVNPDILYFDRNFTYLSNGFTVDGSPVNKTGYTALTSASFSWSTSDGVTATSGSNTASVSSGFELSVSGTDTLVITNSSDNPLTETFPTGSFNWVIDNSSALKNIGDPPVSVAVTSGIDIHSVGGRWFKITCDNDSGTVTFDFGSKVKYLELYIRSVIDPNQSVSNWSVVPDSITPSLGATDTENHLCVFDNLNASTLTFDYSSNTDVLLTALWINSISYFKPQKCTLKYEFEAPINDLGTTITLANDSQRMEHSAASAIAVSGSQSITFDDEYQSLALEFDTGYGDFSIRIDSGELSDSGYGAHTNGNNGFLLMPEAASTTTLGFDGDGFGVSGGSSQKWTVKLKARLSSGLTGDVLLAAGSKLLPNLITVQEDLKDIEFEISNGEPPTSLPKGLGIFTFRGIYSGKGWDAENPDIDFTIDVESVSFLPSLSESESELKIFYVEDNVRRQIPTFRVADANLYKSKLPEGICFYDQTGLVAVSENYQNVIGTLLGEGDNNSIAVMRDISIRATGKDYITCDFVGEPISTSFFEQKNWIEHVSEICNLLDYFWYENEVGEGITIVRRWTLGDPIQGEIPQKIVNSVTRKTETARQSRYIVEYQKDYSDETLSKTIKSEVGYIGEVEPKTISAPIDLEADARALAQTITRDSIENDVREVEIDGVGHGIRPGQAWYIHHHRLPRFTPCLVRQVSENDETSPSSTRIGVKILRTD